jgi:hypothetical protein
MFLNTSSIIFEISLTKKLENRYYTCVLNSAINKLFHSCLQHPCVGGQKRELPNTLSILPYLNSYALKQPNKEWPNCKAGTYESGDILMFYQSQRCVCLTSSLTYVSLPSVT